MDKQPIIEQVGEIKFNKDRRCLTFRLYEGIGFYAKEINDCTVEQITQVGLVGRYEISLEYNEELKSAHLDRKILKALRMISMVIEEEQKVNRKVEAGHAMSHSAHSLVGEMPYNPDD